MPSESRVHQSEDILNTIIELLNELFVGQVEEVIDMLTERLAERFPPNQAVNKASHIVAKYYFNIAEA